MAKTKKAPVAKAAGFADKSGYLLAIGDQVRYEVASSPNNNRHGILTAIHERELDTIGTVEFLYDSHWQASPAMPAFAENLAFISREAFVVGERAKVEYEQGDNYTSRDHAYTGREGRVARITPNAPFADIVLLEFNDPKLEDCEFQATDLLRTAMAEPVAIEPEPVAKPAPKKEASFQDIIDGTASIAAGLRLVPLASIVVTTNTRKVFDETALAELAESLKAHGILQPIVLRPHSEAGQYELVAGGRRYRAAQLAGLTEMPATVRQLTDREFLEVQLLENLQRVDVRPADEAEAFAKLLKNGFALEEIAAKVGKPARFVAERARLMELLPEWVEALQQGRLLIGSAYQLARLTRQQQTEAHQQLQRSYGEQMDVAGTMLPVYGAAEIRQHLAHKFAVHDLEAAAFPKDDADLYVGAGPCTLCPKRSGNTLYLFDEMGGNKCLDGSCFEVKTTRYVAQMAVQLSVGGQPVLKVAENWGRVPADTLNLNKWQNPERFKAAELEELRQAGRVRPALMMEGPRAGHVVDVVLEAAVASQPDVVAAIKQQRQAQTQKEKEEAAQVRALGAARRQAYYQLTADVHGQGLYTAVLLRRILYKKLEYHSYGSLRALLQRVYGWEELKGGSYLDEKERKRVLGYLAAMDVPQLHALMLDIQLLSWLEEEHPSTLPALCKELGWSDEQLLAAHAERKKGKKQEATA